MAHTKATGSTRLGRDSRPKYLGVKVFDGQRIKPGEIIVRQRGTKIFPGRGVKKGADDTLYALKEGVIKFSQKRMKNFAGIRKTKTIVQVI